MAEQHDKFLAALGVSADTIKKLNELTPEQLKDFKADELAMPVTQSYETRFLNDNNFLKKLQIEKLPESILKTIEGNQYGRFMTELKEVAEKELGLKIDTFSEDEQKSLKKFFRKANADYVQLKAGDKTTLTELQKQLSNALRDKEQVETDAQKRITDAVQLEKNRLNSSIEKLSMKSHLSSLHQNGFELKVNPDYIVDAVIGKMKSKYAINVGDDFTIDIKQKDNPQLDILNKSGQKVTFDEALLEVLNADKMVTKIEQQQGNGQEQQPVKIKIGGDGKSTTELPSYISKNIQANIDAEKKAVGQS